MEDGGPGQKRRAPRAKLLMAASIEHGGRMMPVTLRDLSAEGALVEIDPCPRPGSRVVLHKNELAVSGRIAWAKDRRAGIAFDASLDPEAVLRHLPPPRPIRDEVHKRPGFRGRLSAEERRFAESYFGGRLPFIER